MKIKDDLGALREPSNAAASWGIQDKKSLGTKNNKLETEKRDSQ